MVPRTRLLFFMLTPFRHGKKRSLENSPFGMDPALRCRPRAAVIRGGGGVSLCGCCHFDWGFTAEGFHLTKRPRLFQIPYKIAPRRTGDVASCYADPALAEREMGWKATRDLAEMCTCCSFLAALLHRAERPKVIVVVVVIVVRVCRITPHSTGCQSNETRMR